MEFSYPKSKWEPLLAALSLFHSFRQKKTSYRLALFSFTIYFGSNIGLGSKPSGWESIRMAALIG